MEYEINISTSDKLGTIKKLAPELLKGKCYIFFDEPWSEIMIRSDDYEFLSGIADMADCRAVKRYDERSDIDGFGEQYWDDVKLLFETATRIGLKRLVYKKRHKLLTADKLVHCILNNLGYTRSEEQSAYLLWGQSIAWGSWAQYVKNVLLILKKQYKQKRGLYKL